jgi:aminoglycoside phosphotransferase (APT) family kinase protein
VLVNGVVPDLGVTELVPLDGGVSGAAVWRARWSGRDVVIKRTTHSEVLVLRLLQDLDEPSFPTLLRAGQDQDGWWIVIPFHPGRPIGIVDGLPVEVHRCMGRLHARFAGEAGSLAGQLESIDDGFVERSLCDFGPAHLHRARKVIGERLFRRAISILGVLAADTGFRTAVGRFAPTLLHGDLYGLNVLHPEAGSPMIIDWNSARLGPAAFDVAMTARYDSPARIAHDEGWATVTGRFPEPYQAELAHHWSSALINSMYAGVVAVRSSATAAEQMVTDAEEAAARFAQLCRR